MKFRYAFQKIVDLKSNEKTQAEWILSGAVSHLQGEEQSLKALQQEKEGIQKQVNAFSGQATTVSQLQMLQHYLDHLDHRIHAKNQDVDRAHRNVVQTRDMLTEKMMEEKVWNRARDKALQNFHSTALKQEQEALDELAVTRHRLTT